jgi:hypothetical protein
MLPPQLKKQKKFKDDNAQLWSYSLRGRLSYMVQFETVYWLMPKLVSMEEREYP